jgi:hypothetical protein
MKLAIMQPYFLPYIGYFQLMDAVDTFVIYDNIQYTKKGWINRNQILSNGSPKVFTIPILKDSDYADIRDRLIANTFNKTKLINQIRGAYFKAPQFEKVFPLLETIIRYHGVNLFDYIKNSLITICNYLEIDVRILVSSTIDIDHRKKSHEKVISICNKIGCNAYVNAIGGLDLYNKENFSEKGINLIFIKSKEIKYKQFQNDFEPRLSIIDVMMFNSQERINQLLKGYDLV